MKPTIGKTEAGKDLVIDLPRLLVSRMLIQASSGGGKSWATRRILEQTAGHVQQVILDIEGEFSSLREKFDYIICAPNGADAVANVQTSTILARRLRETRASAIIDMYEMPILDRKRFVRLFLEEYVEAPKSMWHSCIVAIAEAHHFCPEKGEAESMAAVNDLITRGRKRGLCGILDTQRLSKLNKDSAAELHNKLIGLAVLDTDVKRAADDLGLTTKEAMPILRSLEPGEFFCFGPALNRTVTKIKVGPVVTTHPEPGSTATVAPPPPSNKIRALLAKLTDLPKEAEQEARTLVDLKRENASLKRDLTLAKKAQPRQPATEIKKIPTPVVGKRATKAIQDAAAKMRKMAKSVSNSATLCLDATKAIESAVSGLESKIEQITKGAPATTEWKPAANSSSHEQRPVLDARSVAARIALDNAQTATAPPMQRKVESGNGAGLTGPQQRILNAIAWFESIGITEPEQTAVAFLAGYTVGGGAWNNPRGALRTMGLIKYQGERLALTEDGRQYANAPTVPLTNDALHRSVMERLPGPERKLLAVLIQQYPAALPDAELADATGYSVGGGAFANPKGRLRSLGLITYPSAKASKAADLLFLAE